MKEANKKEARLAEAERRRRTAFQKNDIEAFAQAVADLQDWAEGPDEYTCPQCGQDFEGDHLELLIAGVQVIENREVIFGRDYGIQTVSRDARAGRRIKFCRICLEGWVIPIPTYLEMR